MSRCKLVVFLSDLRSKPFEAGDLMRAHWQLQNPFSACLLLFLLLIFMPRISTHFLLISFLSCPSNHTDTPAPAVPNLFVLIQYTSPLKMCVSDFILSCPAAFGEIISWLGFNPWVRKIPWRRNGNPLQYPCLGNPMDRGPWLATVHRITKSWTQLSN